jgi:ABC-type uncharacterized transport system substrate-binding protein
MQFDQLKRREFITLIGGVAAWPLAARAQQGERMKRIGVLMNLAADDPESRARMAALLHALQEMGWNDGQNLRVDTRWAAGVPELFHAHARELVALAPDVILGAATPSVAALQQATRTVPIVFVTIVDPVSSGFVTSLARPGGNTTGFALYEYGTSTKWLELLKAITPAVQRVAVLRDPSSVSGVGQLAAIQAVAPLFGVELTPMDVRDAPEIERALTVFARSPNAGLIVTPSPVQVIHRELIIALATRNRLPAIYAFRFMAVGGGLISYGPDSIDPYRQAAGYIDRILKGEKAADLPVQHATKYELVINLKTAKALGLTVPDKLLALADEVIE